VDTGNGWCEPAADGRQRWDDAIGEFLAAQDADVLFVAGWSSLIARTADGAWLSAGLVPAAGVVAGAAALGPSSRCHGPR
jgi:hypothetical protein